jgi:ATPase family protein associated with various cellular activities (AAA)
MNDETRSLRGEHGPLPLQINLGGDFCDLADTLLKARALQAFDCGARRLPIHRAVRFAAQRTLEDIFDDLALNAGLVAHRVGTAALLLDGPGVFVSAGGWRKMDYSTGSLEIWAEDTARVEATRTRLLGIVGPQRSSEEMFTVDWWFSAARGLANIAVDEFADAELLDEAYPSLGSVKRLIDDYLAAPETVLVLQGPPGTGKTRLVRAVLAAISRRKRDSAKVMYTADRRALENDEIFVEFITGAHDAFVVEDADHILTPRADGNDNLHRFLCIADGVVRALGRKIIFTTNLPNIGDIDEALLRPGRCFAVLRTRNLERPEAQRLLTKVLNGDGARAGAALPDSRTVSLANVFRAVSAPAEASPGTTARSPAADPSSARATRTHSSA